VDFGLVYSVVNQAIYFGVTFPIGMRRPRSVECAIWRIKSARRRDFEHGEIGPDLFRAACRFGLEAMASKRRDRPYRAGAARPTGSGEKPKSSGDGKGQGVVLMIDAVFWYTGLAAWVLIVFGVVSPLIIEAHERSVWKRGQRLHRR
jgi:hypothetical protein